MFPPGNEQPESMSSPPPAAERISPRARRARAFVKAPAAVIAVTAGIAHREYTTHSQAAAALQIMGLAHLLLGHRTLAFLPTWCRPTHNPRVPFLLGMPRPWLDFVATLREETDFLAPGRGGTPLIRTMHPITFPPLQKTRYDVPPAWLAGAREAGRHLRVPAGHLLGLLQTVGILAYASQMRSAEVFFGQHAREHARSNRDLFILTPVRVWAPLASLMLYEAVRLSEPDEYLERMASAVTGGDPWVAQRAWQERQQHTMFRGFGPRP